VGQIRMGPPRELLLALQRRFDLQHFIETGTYRGDTAAWAAQHFPQVTTIELSDSYHRAAVARFTGQSKVSPLLGNSAAVLRELTPTLSSASLFWLDAHWSGLDTAGREAECPILDEIGIINASQVDHIIVVDDARLFCAPPPRPHRADHWPDLLFTATALGGNGRRYVALFEDVFVAVPNAGREFVVELLQDCTTAVNSRRRPGAWWKRLAE
jgi:hypothetical protein